MKLISLKQRNNACHSAKKCRVKGEVPGVMYGKAQENFLFEVSEMDLYDSLKNSGEHGLLNVNVLGEKKKVLVKEVQKDPLTRKIIHLDLETVKSGENIVSSVPLKFTGETLLKKKGAIIQKEKESIKVNCPIEELPKNIEVDLSSTKAGDVLRIHDLEISDEINIVDELDSVVLSVGYEQKIKEVEE